MVNLTLYGWRLQGLGSSGGGAWGAGYLRGGGADAASQEQPHPQSRLKHPLIHPSAHAPSPSLHHVHLHQHHFHHLLLGMSLLLCSG